MAKTNGRFSICNSATTPLRTVTIRALALLVLTAAFLHPGSVSGQATSANGPPSVQRGFPQTAQASPARREEQPQAAGGRSPGFDVQQMLSPGGLTSTLEIMALLTVLSLAPSILIMTTCFVRFVIILGLLRQALGTQQLPPNQVMISLCLFLTFLVMAPVWKEAYHEGVLPYTDPQPGQVRPNLETAFENTVRPLRQFMIDQIEATDNGEAVLMFLEFQRPDPDSSAGQNYTEPEFYEDLPLSVLLPAFMLSELKTAFIIGFQLYLPFVIIDMVVSSLLISMGMMMLPPVLISLPFKLLLFVLIDGWTLTVGMMLSSVQPFG